MLIFECLNDVDNISVCVWCFMCDVFLHRMFSLFHQQLRISFTFSGNKRMRKNLL